MSPRLLLVIGRYCWCVCVCRSAARASVAEITGVSADNCLLT